MTVGSLLRLAASHRGVRRRATLLGAVVAAFSAVVVMVAPPASAHAVLLSTSPAAGYSVSGPVELVSLTFSERVTATSDAVRISGPTPGLRSLARSTEGGRTLLVATGPLRPGVYAVRWQVTADDGDVVDGSYQFAVGVSADTGSLASSSRPDAVNSSFLETVVLRWVVFAALAAALGGLVGRLLVRSVQTIAAQVGAQLPEPWQMPVRPACLFGVVAAVALAAHAADGASFLSGLSSLRPSRLNGGAAAVPMTEALLFSVSAVLSSTRGRIRVLAVAPLLGIAFAEGVRGHLRAQDGAVGAVLIGVHVAAAAAWTGALLVVLQTASRWRTAGRGNAGWQLVHTYSRAALVAYLLVTGTGTTAAVLLLPSWVSLTDTRYGVALLAKLALVAGVTVLALRSRRQLGRTEFSTNGLRLGLLEPRALTAVLAAAAVLVSLVPPRLLARAAAPSPPPAPTGPVVQLGTLAGQLTVGVTVAAGQVRVLVSSAASDDGQSDEDLVVTASATSLAGSARNRTFPLRLSRCGDGCFVAPASVTAPGVRLDVTAQARDWHGGRVRLDVPWPPVPATALLKELMQVLVSTPAVVLRESVTSDTSRATPAAVTIHDSGPDFLSTEPYGDGRGVRAIELPADRGLRRLAFGVGDGIFVELTIDASGRLVGERLVTPNHLITRQFTYPEKR